MNPLDLHVIRAALYDARRLVRAGISPEDAVSQVCRGAWVPHRQFVYASLVNCVALPLPSARLADPVPFRTRHIAPNTSERAWRCGARVAR
jgi:hypothetical protein